jgi:hypothetical protein
MPFALDRSEPPFSQQLRKVLRRNTIGLIFLACSAGVMLLAYAEHVHLYTPSSMSLSTALASLHSGSMRYATLDGQPDTTIKLYNVFPNDDVVHKAEKLSSFSPVDGIPLNGPDAVAPSEWPSLIGARVRLTGPLSAYKFIDDGDSRWYFYRAAAGTENVFAMARFVNFYRNGKSYLADMFSFSSQVALWLKADAWTGVLTRDQPEQLKAQLAGSEVENSWIVESNVSLNTAGRSFYVPLQSSEQKIWIQVPLDLAD